jgi:cation-transporting ATPase E
VAYYLTSPQPDTLAVARTVLTTLTTFGGLILIVFVEPPTPFWTGGDDFSGDWRPTILAVILGVIYLLIMVIPSLREFFELSALRLVDYGVMAVLLLIWTLVLRFTWHAQIFTRFLRLDGA